jgi:hypothetical protein
MLFQPKYKNYKKTKAIRIPEELADDVLLMCRALDDHQEKVNENEELMSTYTIVQTVIKFIKSQDKQKKESD